MNVALPLGDVLIGDQGLAGSRLDLGTAGGVVISVVGRWGLRVSSSEGFPQLVERARDVGRAICEVLEELAQPLQHAMRLT